MSESRESFLPVRTAGLLIGLALSGSSSPAAAPGFEGLLRNSPFANTPGAEIVGESAPPLEFRGMLVEGEVYYFSIYDPGTNASRWVGLNQPGNPFTVQQYDSDHATIVVRHKGSTLNLALKQARVVASQPEAPAHLARGRSTVMDRAAVLAAEADRIEAVGEELRPLHPQAN